MKIPLIMKKKKNVKYLKIRKFIKDKNYILKLINRKNYSKTKNTLFKKKKF